MGRGRVFATAELPSSYYSQGGPGRGGVGETSLCYPGTHRQVAGIPSAFAVLK